MGVFFAILSSALYGVNNYIDKICLEKYKIPVIVISIYSGIIALFVSILLVIFIGFPHIEIRLIYIIVASGFLTALYILPYFKALSLDETSRVIPLFQSVPIFVLILSFVFLQEKLFPIQYIGSALIIIGAFLLGVKKTDKRLFQLRPAFWYMMLSSFLSAVAIILYKFGVDEVSFLETLPYEGFGIFLGAVAIALYPKNISMFLKSTRQGDKKVYMFIGINEIVYLCARYSSYFALSFLSAGIVSILGGIQPLFVLGYGIILSMWFPHILREVINKKTLILKIVSIALITIGTYFVFQ